MCTQLPKKQTERRTERHTQVDSFFNLTKASRPFLPFDNTLQGNNISQLNQRPGGTGGGWCWFNALEWFVKKGWFSMVSPCRCTCTQHNFIYNPFPHFSPFFFFEKKSCHKIALVFFSFQNQNNYLTIQKLKLKIYVIKSKVKRNIEIIYTMCTCIYNIRNIQI